AAQVPHVGRVARRGHIPRPLPASRPGGMEGGAPRCADAAARADPRGDESRGRRPAAAAAASPGAAPPALPHGTAPVLRRLALLLPPSVARLAAVPAAEPRAAEHRRLPRGAGSDLE